jgi:hypothetical protein
MQKDAAGRILKNPQAVSESRNQNVLRGLFRRT